MTSNALTIEYDGEESMTHYLRRVEEFKAKLVNERYDKLVQFVNEWLKLEGKSKLTSLTEFRWITEDSLLEDEENNSKLLYEYNNLFTNDFNLTINKKNTSKEYIIDVFRRAINSLGYSLRHRKKGKIMYYTVRTQK
jgi:hypothetical protein